MTKTIEIDGQKYNLVPVDEPTLAPRKKWEPKGGDWYVNSAGEVDNGCSIRDARLFGTEYPTKELANKARDAMRIHHLLLSRKMEECPDDGVHFLYRNVGKLWTYAKPPSDYFYPDVVLFTEKVADKICGELNDPELNFLNI